MVICRIVWGKPRRPRVTYASVCLLFNGGCYRYGAKWQAEWCPSCRHLWAIRDEARKAKRRATPRGAKDGDRA